MLKVAILDDYQNVSQQFVDIEKLSGKYEIKIFFINEQAFLIAVHIIQMLISSATVYIMYCILKNFFTCFILN